MTLGDRIEGSRPSSCLSDISDPASCSFFVDFRMDVLESVCPTGSGYLLVCGKLTEGGASSGGSASGQGISTGDT